MTHSDQWVPAPSQEVRDPGHVVKCFHSLNEMSHVKTSSQLRETRTKWNLAKNVIQGEKPGGLCSRVRGAEDRAPELQGEDIDITHLSNRENVRPGSEPQGPVGLSQNS